MRFLTSLSFCRYISCHARSITNACLAVVVMNIAFVLTAQQPDKTAPQVIQSQVPKGRLPAHYSKVVTPQQRYRIYYIQYRYQQAISKLEKQLDWLKQHRESEIAKVLTNAQRARVEQLRLQASKQNQQLIPADPFKQKDPK